MNGKNVAQFVDMLVHAFNVTLVRGDVQRELDMFNEVCYASTENMVTFRDVEILKCMYDYGDYNLYVFYYEDHLLIFIVDGVAGGYAVAGARALVSEEHGSRRI